MNAMCTFIYLVAVYFSFAPVISISIHRYVHYFDIQVLMMVTETETLTSTLHHNIFTYLDYVFFCYLHWCVYIYIYIHTPTPPHKQGVTQVHFFYAEFFLRPIAIPRFKKQSAQLLTHSWGENNCMHTFPKNISVMCKYKKTSRCVHFLRR